MKPIGRYIEVTTPKEHSTTDGGILVGKSYQAEGVVLSIGDEVDELQVDDRIIYPSTAITEKNNRYYIHADNVVAKLN